MRRHSARKFFRRLAIAMASLCTLVFSVVFVAMLISEPEFLALGRARENGGFPLPGLVLWLILSGAVFAVTWALVRLLGWCVTSMMRRGR